jgi:hypothetical protein
MLLSSYKAMFNYLGSSRNTREGESFITKAFEHRGSISTDIINFKEEINFPAVAQHLGLLTHLKAWSFVRQNAMHKCIKTLWIDEKEGAQKTHPTCAFTPRQDEISKNDSVYQKSY